MPAWLEPGLAGYVPVDGRPRPARDVPAYVDFLCDMHPVGSPEHCARRWSVRTERPGSSTSSSWSKVRATTGGPWRTSAGWAPRCCPRCGDRTATRRCAGWPARSAQQSTSSGFWLRICARGVTNSREGLAWPPGRRRRPGGSSGRRACTPKWRSSAPRIASLARQRRSCPRASSSGGGTVVVGELGAGLVTLLDQLGDHRPGVGQGVADAGDERRVVDLTGSGLVEQIVRNGQRHAVLLSEGDRVRR